MKRTQAFGLRDFSHTLLLWWADIISFVKVSNLFFKKVLPPVLYQYTQHFTFDVTAERVGGESLTWPEEMSGRLVLYFSGFLFGTLGKYMNSESGLDITKKSNLSFITVMRVAILVVCIGVYYKLKILKEF